MRYQDAAFLYEQASEAFADAADAGKAFSAGADAAFSWANASSYERMLNRLVSLLGEIPARVDPADVYKCRRLQLCYYVDLAAPQMNVIRRCQEAAYPLYSEILPSGSDINSIDASLAFKRGFYEESYSLSEIAFSKAGSAWDGISFGKWYLASQCAQAAILLQRADEAEAWIENIGTSSRLDISFTRSLLKLALAVMRRDESSTSLLLDELDAVGNRVQSLSRRNAMSLMAITVYSLDSSMGDPSSPGHPSNQRLADVVDEDAYPLFFRERASLAVLAHRIAALRYAAGFRPEEDFFDRPALMRRFPGGCPMPEQITPRLHAARAAWEAAASIGRRIDENFECERRQQHLSNLRDRIERIAAAC